MIAMLYDKKSGGSVLILQLLVFVFLTLVFSLKGSQWSVSALICGAAVWLPNIAFMSFIGQSRANVRNPKRMIWSLALGEALKVITTITLLIIALGVLKLAFLPLIFTYLAMLMAQILAPIMMNNHRS